MSHAINKTTNENCLEALDLSCVRHERVLFESLNIELRNGDILLIEGVNGSGKSSLLRILSGLRRPDSGMVSWNGKAIEQSNSESRGQIAYVGHLDGIKLDLTAQENLEFALSLGRPSTLTLSDVLREIDLDGYNDIPTRLLSAGQRRRLALGRLLATENKAWILDEPFTALDKGGIHMFEAMIREYAADQGIVVLSSHHDTGLLNSGICRINLSQC